VARTVGSAADDTRQRILDVAVDLFIERGYAGTSVRDISERLGMTKGSLYYHFASKEDLLTALVEPMMTALDEFISEAEHRSQPADRAMIERLVNILDTHGVILRSLMSDPSVLRGLAIKQAMPQRLAALQRAVAGAADESSAIRGRCAIGLINAGTIAPRFGATTPDGSADRELAVRFRLSDEDKRYVVDAALAVLGLPAA
jgi:AcrR family transcriptional regulator